MKKFERYVTPGSPGLLQSPPLRSEARCAGKVRPMVLLWALGVPIPIVLIILLFRGCA